MFAIETEHGRFEADTEKEAKKQMRAAQRKAQREADMENERRATAALRARSEAYRLYWNKNYRSDMPDAWRLCPVSSQSYPCRHTGNERPAISTWAKYDIETEHGRAQIRVADSLDCYIENGAGYCMAIGFAGPQDFELFAVGICEGAVVWEPLPGIVRGDFRSA